MIHVRTTTDKKGRRKRIKSADPFDGDRSDSPSPLERKYDFKFMSPNSSIRYTARRTRILLGNSICRSRERRSGNGPKHVSNCSNINQNHGYRSKQKRLQLNYSLELSMHVVQTREKTIASLILRGRRTLCNVRTNRCNVYNHRKTESLKISWPAYRACCVKNIFLNIFKSLGLWFNVKLLRIIFIHFIQSIIYRRRCRGYAADAAKSKI